jgi:toxin secretion/phage lysis holin
MNEMKSTLLCWWGSVLLPGMLTLLGGWDKGLHALCVLVIIDLVAAWMAMIYNRRRFDRNKAFDGAVKKFVYVLVIVAATHADIATGTTLLRSTWIIYFSALEMSSILCHAGMCGIPIPNWIGKYVEGVIDKIRNGKGLPCLPEEVKPDADNQNPGSEN